MINDIKEINFPSYATISSATATIENMGDRSINATVKIYGQKKPDFSGPWEVEFLGDRYIQPLLEPQASKDNTSLNSTIELTFQHWAIYQMKRYMFVALANVESGTPIADKYIVPLGLSLPEFAKAFDDVLRFYFPDRSIYVYVQDNSYINPSFTDYDPQRKYLEISYTYIWEVLQKTYELYNCWWTIERDQQGKYAIKFGYPVAEHDNIFTYDEADGGLVKIERQVQDADIRNQLLGRGGNKNLPYMYFKDYEKFHPNSDSDAYQNIGLPDPDAIPELENIFFSELRDLNFRSYVQGWLVNPSPHRITSTADGWSVTWNQEATIFTESDGTVHEKNAERMESDWAYAKGATDEYFDPVEFVKDDESIEKYGLLQGGLDNNEEIFPSLQGMTLELPCIIDGHNGHRVQTRVDEVVDVEPVITDDIEKNSVLGEIPTFKEEYKSDSAKSTPRVKKKKNDGEQIDVTFYDIGIVECQTPVFDIETDFTANFITKPTISSRVSYQVEYYQTIMNMSAPAGGWPHMMSGIYQHDFDAELVDYDVYDANTGEKLQSVTNLPSGSYYIRARINVKNKDLRLRAKKVYNGYQFLSDVHFRDCYTRFTIVCDFYKFNGEIIPNRIGTNPISETKTIAKGETASFHLIGTEFEVPESGALYIDQQVYLDPNEFTEYEKTIKILDMSSGEVLPITSLNPGNYKVVVDVIVRNVGTDQNQRTFTVSLAPAFLYYNMEYEGWKPTFDIWIKNVFDTSRGDYSADDEYVLGVWGPLVTTQKMAVTFATGNLSGHSDWEFLVAEDGIHYDNSKTLVITDDEGVEHEVRSEWRLTLIKSDAEADSIHKYVPYKDFNAAKYDLFYFTNIYLPWAYVFAAERRLNEYKEGQLDKTKNIDPTWIIGLNKIWASRHGNGDIMNTISVGDKITLKDKRFIRQTGIQMIVKSMSITWGEITEQGIGLPDIELVLSNKIETSQSTIKRISGEVEELSAKVSGFSNLERQIRGVCDAVYLRKDGFEDTSYSPTRMAKDIQSENFRHGLVGGEGWSIDVNEDGVSVLEVDRVNVRQEMNVGNIVVNQITSIGGKEILSAASIIISNVEPIGNTDDEDLVMWKCYFDTRDGSVANMFVAGDIAMSQVFDEEQVQLKYYRCEVYEVGPDYIILNSKNKSGLGDPSVGDVVVQYGNINDTDRQSVIVRNVIGNGYEQMISGLNSTTSNGQVYYFAGSLYGDPFFFVGDASHYVNYEDGELEIKAKVKILPGSDGADNIIPWATTDTTGATTTIAGGAILSNIIGVSDENEDMVAGMNASDNWEDPTHGKLAFFAGTDENTEPDDAAYKVYADGTVVANKLIANNADVNGTIVSGNGNIGGFAISYSSLQASESYSSLYLSSGLLHFSNTDTKVDAFIGDNIFPAQVGGWTGAIRADINDGDPYNYGNENVGAYFDIQGTNRKNSGVYVAHGMFSGLRPRTKVINGNSTLSEVDFTVIVNNNATIKLPSNPQGGQTYLVFIADRYSVTFDGNGKNIKRVRESGTTIAPTQGHTQIRGADMLVFDADSDMWIMSGYNGS